MEITNVNEHEDGSATLDINFETEEVRMLLEYAIRKILSEEFKIYDK